MDELSYARYIQRAKEAESIYKTIEELYEYIPWKQAYFMAIRDQLLSKEQKELVKEFYPVK